MSKSEEVEAAVRTVGKAIERAQARRAAAGEESPFPPEAQDVLDLTEHLVDRIQARREAEGK